MTDESEIHPRTQHYANVVQEDYDAIANNAISPHGRRGAYDGLNQALATQSVSYAILALTEAVDRFTTTFAGSREPDDDPGDLEPIPGHRVHVTDISDRVRVQASSRTPKRRWGRPLGDDQFADESRFGDR